LANIDMAYPQVGEVQGERVRYRDDKLEPGNRYFYQVVGYDRGDHPGLPSPVVSQVWDVLPQTPFRLEARAGDRQVMLTWPAVTLLVNGSPLSGGANYNIYREARGSGFILVNASPVTEPEFQDITVANDIVYRYTVRTVRQVGSSYLESLDSPIQTVTPVDLTAPAPVLNLVAVATEKGIELRWEAGREADLAGYQVYRRSLAEPQFRSLTTPLVAAPYFVDLETARGVTYFYYVVAVDNSPRANQSLPSETVEITR
jgi:fibronectin type 3 domain-containing protein